MEYSRPLEHYRQELKDKMRAEAERTFDHLAETSQVDIEANSALCDEIYALEHDCGSKGRRLTIMTVLCVLMWLAVVGAVLYAIFGHAEVGVIVAVAAGAVACLVTLFAWVHPAISRLRGERKNLQEQINDKTNEAWRQMEPLNRLHGWDTFYRLFTATLPGIRFDNYMCTARLSQLAAHGMAVNLGGDTSVLYSHSGMINGNPFVLYRQRRFHMGTKRYTGEKVIHWTTRERDTDGKYVTRHHSQTLRASLVKPYPEFPETTHLVYGHAAAPELTFHRTKNTFNYKEGNLLFNIKKKRLERKSRKMSQNFAMATNSEFEVLFTTTDRSDNQQYFLLFTPLAQQSMIELMQDEEDAYGDDFEFIKCGRINHIVSDHLQGANLDLNPARYRHYDFRKARQNFIDHNCGLFRIVYFGMAPLLTIPLYHEAPHGYMTSIEDVMLPESSHWEHETQANMWGETYFKAPESVTHNILKTSIVTRYDGVTTVNVTAHGFASRPRVTCVRVYGADGRNHNVDVHWDEYIPVTGHCTMYLQELPPSATYGDARIPHPVLQRSILSSI